MRAHRHPGTPGLHGHIDDFSLPKAVVDLVHLRASQINGCSVCTDPHSREAKNYGEKEKTSGPQP
jgi:AhpD family alkylhydroperoxidase